NNQVDTNPLSEEYVKKYYKKVLGKLDISYADFRWFRSDIPSYSLAEYGQTKRAIQKALGARKYGSVLEVGGGDGVWTELLLDRSNFITELDISEEMLVGSQKRLGARDNIKFICDDFLENDLVSHSYDLVYAIRCFEYFFDKQRAVREMHRLLRKNGEVLIVTKNPYYVSLRRKKSRVLHSGQIGVDDLKNLLLGEGFDVLFTRPAILGKKFDWFLARVVFGVLHNLTLSPFSWIVPSIAQKYLSESIVLYAKKI
ncbi:MAG: class I SAM-dependent methyltransferase, partial [Candidatus Spechtbacterales bacterium]